MIQTSNFVVVPRVQDVVRDLLLFQQLLSYNFTPTCCLRAALLLMANLLSLLVTNPTEKVLSKTVGTVSGFSLLSFSILPLQ